ncbi:MAG: type II toxin-antitoxin system HigB family toxin [Chitinophagaceae bacterium]|nr:type II toxin-antitoxin system HigB family toxin [Chitinophagaceae bacterium]
MVIIARPMLREFILRYPISANALNKWYIDVSKADWKNLQELKRTFNSCDYIGNDRYVFDIAGNRFRLIAMIHFRRRTIYIRKILTHDEYTAWSKKGLLDSA